MSIIKIVHAFRTAISREENWKDDGPRWTFIDADMYMDCLPKTPKETEKFYHLFNDLADIHDTHYDGLSFAEYTAKRKDIDAEYNQLFGMAQ